MSVISCDNSALVFPSSYPYGAVGSVIEPTINTVAVADAALLQPIASLTLPKGVWAIQGTLYVAPVTGGQTLIGNTGIAKDAVVFWRSQIATASAGYSVCLSAVVSSDGTNAITIPMTYDTSAGSTYGVSASPLSKVQLIRIA